MYAPFPIYSFLHGFDRVWYSALPLLSVAGRMICCAQMFHHSTAPSVPWTGKHRVPTVTPVSEASCSKHL